MIHKNNHPHAFIDKDNIVIDIIAFEEWAHNDPILNSIQEQRNATDVICCCDHGTAYIGGIWTGTEFRKAQPYQYWVWDVEKQEWNPPTEMPDDGDYIWDGVTNGWVPRT